MLFPIHAIGYCWFGCWQLRQFAPFIGYSFCLHYCCYWTCAILLLIGSSMLLSCSWTCTILFLMCWSMLYHKCSPMLLVWSSMSYCCSILFHHMATMFTDALLFLLLFFLVSLLVICLLAWIRNQWGNLHRSGREYATTGSQWWQIQIRGCWVK